MPRFVILHHVMPPSGGRASHWDFMLEQRDVLRTWALEAEPRVGVEVACRPLPDHRLAYLTYEGPVSGDRGAVTQWDAGAYRVASEQPDRLVVRLTGRRIQGTVELTHHESLTGDRAADDARPSAQRWFWSWLETSTGGGSTNVV